MPIISCNLNDSTPSTAQFFRRGSDLFKSNPLEDLTVVTLPEKYLDFIMKDGEIYKNEIE